MIQRDYILRMVQLFFEAIAKFIRTKEGKDNDVLRDELGSLYKSYLKQQREDFYAMDAEQIIRYFNDDDNLYKIEILAELIYQDALLDTASEPLLIKSLALFRHLDMVSDTFSLNHNRKIAEIESLLSNQ